MTDCGNTIIGISSGDGIRRLERDRPGLAAAAGGTKATGREEE